ncbi:MAG: glycosyltransferase family 2 protein [Clostridia bacterium]|nr:glycosyltransferase family 2 protein [Clostridia bacterium]
MDLSIIIPVYNAKEHLAQTLGSVLSQESVFSFEIVAVDDGSVDSSPEILALFAGKAAEKGISLRWERQENRGPAAARNRGLELARGDTILFLDADDRLMPEAVSSLLSEKKRRGASILLFDSVLSYPDGRREPFPACEREAGFLSEEEYMLSLPCPWNKLFDRSLFADPRLRFPEGILYEDLALIPALGSGKAGAIYYDKRVFHEYVQSEHSIMRSPYSPRKRDIFRSLDHLALCVRGHERELEYLYFSHLYLSFAWTFREGGDTEALREMNRLMKEKFPHWQKNPLIRGRTTRKQRLFAHLFYREHFQLIRFWKGIKKA